MQPQPSQPQSQKNLAIAYLLWFPLGLLGAHHYYLGKIGRGVLWTFTAGLFTIGWLMDGVTLPRQVRMRNSRGW